MKEISASIMILAGAILTTGQRTADFLVLGGMVLMVVGILTWIALMLRPSPPPR